MKTQEIEYSWFDKEYNDYQYVYHINDDIERKIYFTPIREEDEDPVLFCMDVCDDVRKDPCLTGMYRVTQEELSQIERDPINFLRSINREGSLYRIINGIPVLEYLTQIWDDNGYPELYKLDN